MKINNYNKKYMKHKSDLLIKEWLKSRNIKQIYQHKKN